MKDPNGEISKTKAERAVKFNKDYNSLNYFVLQDSKLYCQLFKVGQSKRLIMCDYSIADIVEKVYSQLKHKRNLKIFARIQYFYYEINKQIVK